MAKVEREAEEAEMIAKYNATEGVYLGIWPVTGCRMKSRSSTDWSPRWSVSARHCRPDIDMQLVWDGTMFMRNALTEITKTLSETILIVALVVFLFMGSVRTALVPLVAMPVSLIGAAIFMVAFGFSLNLLTLLAIVLSVGLVVDDAIVVVENVERHVRLGKSRIDAALIGARELLGPIIAMTITLATVYTPIGFQGGLTGSLFLGICHYACRGSGVVGRRRRHALAGHEFAVRPPAREGRPVDRLRQSTIRRGAPRLRLVARRCIDHALGNRGGALLIMAMIGHCTCFRDKNSRRWRTKATSACSSKRLPIRRLPPATASI